MPRTKGSLNRPKEVILAAREAAEARREIRKAHEAGTRGRLPEGKNFPAEIRYTAFKTPKPAFDVSTAEVVV